MTDTVRVPRAWLEAFRRDTDPTEPIADDGGTVWDMFCHEATAMLAASPQGEGSSADAHPPQPDALPGDLREKIVRALYCPDISWGTANRKADAILSLIQSERGGG